MFGLCFVTFGVMLEFLGALCMSLIFIWDNISYLMGDYLQMWQIVIITICVLLPTCWILSIAELRIQSFLGCVCKVFTVAVVISTFFVDTSVVEQQTYNFTPASPNTFSISMGIFILSYAGHACLPAIYNSMREPQKFEMVLDICFIIMFITYSTFALFGYLQYGGSTSVIITDNINGNNEQMSIGRWLTSKVLITLVVLSIYFQISPILSVVAEIPELLLNIHSVRQQRIFRTGLFLCMCMVSYVIIEHLAILEAVTGSLCTMITSVICPTLFYFALNRKNISWVQIGIIMVYIVAGVMFGFYLLYNDVISVMEGKE